MLTHKGRTLITLVDDQRREQVYETVLDLSAPRASFHLMVALSSLIASYGLLSDSAAVVIGAMLVAPLMWPIFGIALGLVSGDRRLLWEAGQSEVLGIALALALAVLIGLSPLRPPGTAEMLSRTQPTLFDLLIALLSGLAGAYALMDKRISPALPGVAIATALMPPLATCGLYLAAGRWSLAAGAFMLFVTNFLAIQLATAVVFFLSGFGGSGLGLNGMVRGFVRGFWVSLVGLTMIAVYVTGTLKVLVGDGRLTNYLKTHIAADVRATVGATVTEVKHSRADGKLEVMATVLTPQEIGPEQVEAIERKLQAGLRRPLHLIIRSLISRDCDGLGAVFVPDAERERQAEAEAEAAARQRLVRVLEEQLGDLPGTELVDTRRSLEGALPTIIAVVRTPTPITPAVVARAESALTAALTEPVHLVVRSILVQETTAQGFAQTKPASSAAP